MPRFRKWLPMVLILVFGIGLSLLWKKPGQFKPPVAQSAEAVESGSSGAVPEGFGPIPTVGESGSPATPGMASRQAGVETTSEATRNLASRMSRETGDLQVITHADGRKSVQLGGRFMHMSAVVPGKDGTTEVRCFTDYQEMTAAQAGSHAAGEPQPASHVR